MKYKDDELYLGPIGSIPAGRRRKIPISVVEDGTGNRMVVSRFGDDVWDFWPDFPTNGFPRSKKMIDWAIDLPDGTMLLDPKHRGLLESTKAFAYTLWKEPPEDRKGMKAITVLNIVNSDLPHLLRWMVLRGYGSFREIDDIYGYVAYARSVSKGKGAPCLETVSNRLRVPDYIWRYGESLEDSLAGHPWPGETYNRLAGVPIGPGKPKTPFIPDDIAGKLAKGAVEYVEERASGILEAREAVEKAKRDAVAKGWLPQRVTSVASSVAKERGFDGLQGLNSEVARLRTACFFTVLFFSGIRISEGLSLEEDCVAVEGLPDGRELLWIRGILYKMVDDPNGRPVRWLVPPVVKRAVDVMRKMGESRRTALRQEMGDLEERVRKGKVGKRERMDAERRLADLRSWHRRLFLVFEGSRGEGVVTQRDMSTYFDGLAKALGAVDAGGRPWRVRAHQCRRTFARFVARNTLGDIHYLRQHFKHWGIDQTAFYMYGSLDHELFREIDDARLEFAESMTSRWRTEDVPLAGGAGKKIVELRESGAGTGLGELLPEGIRIRGTGHSNCLSVADEGCGGNCLVDKFDCVDCSKAVIDPGLLDVWRDIARWQEEALKLSDLGEPARARAEWCLEKARETVACLEGKRVTVVEEER